MLSPISFVAVFIARLSPAESSLIMAKGKRRAKFTIAELEYLLDVIDDDEIVSIGNPDWERVWDRHVSTLGKGYSVLLAVCSAICLASFGRVLPICMGAEQFGK